MYDPSTGAYNNSPGVKIRVPGFGNTSSVEFLDPDTSWFMVTQYFHAMVDHFVKKGYERGKNIVGAPYDWRVSPSKYRNAFLVFFTLCIHKEDSQRSECSI